MPVRVALKLRSLRFHSLRLCRIAVFVIRWVVQIKYRAIQTNVCLFRLSISAAALASLRYCDSSACALLARRGKSREPIQDTPSRQKCDPSRCSLSKSAQKRSNLHEEMRRVPTSDGAGCVPLTLCSVAPMHLRSWLAFGCRP